VEGGQHEKGSESRRTFLEQSLQTDLMAQFESYGCKQR